MCCLPYILVGGGSGACKESKLSDQPAANHIFGSAPGGKLQQKRDVATNIDKNAKEKRGLENRSLSKAGRLTLVKSVISSLPVYYLSLFLCQVELLNK